ncbi:MAG: GTPase ObgE [Candidatus Absconditabacterales bacterium]
MRFYDEVTISVQSGKGGDGTVTGRREAGVAFGGPSGGDGGKGGSVILQALKNENTLQTYRYRSTFKANPGEAGKSRDQYGANAENLILYVPIGTLVRDKLTDEILYTFTKDGEQYTAVFGGEGGWGNIHFKDSIHQFPTFCLLGEPGNKKELVLELQLLADVALIGTPSVGKTSIINSISNTKAKVADYPFTTLIPNLGSITVQDVHFNMIDIPGLIKGAAEGRGLGNAFLRHILKARVFCMIGDISRYDQGIIEIPQLLEEICTYTRTKFSKDPNAVDIQIKEDKGMITLFIYEEGKLVIEKRMLFLINKYDLVNDADILKEYKAQFRKQILDFFKKNKIGIKITKKLMDEHTFTVSAATHFGIDERLKKVVEMLEKTDVQEVYHVENIPHQEVKHIANSMRNIGDHEKEVLIEENYISAKDAQYINVREVYNEEFAKLVRQLQRGNDEAEARFRKLVGNRGTLDELENNGIQKGDILKVLSPYNGQPPKYIQY